MPSSSLPVEFLRCPVSGQGLMSGAPDLLATMIARQRAGELRDESRQLVTGTLSGILMRADGLMAYAILADIPVLLPGSGIPV